MMKPPYHPFTLSALALFLAALLTAYPSKATQHGAESCSSKPLAEELQPLQGTWQGALVGDTSHAKITITITGDSLHFHRDSKFWFKTTFTLPIGTDPKQLHATIKECPLGQETSVGKVVVSFFKIENGTLTLVAMGEGTDETPKTFEAAEEHGWTRYELKKVQPSKETTQPAKSK